MTPAINGMTLAASIITKVTGTTAFGLAAAGLARRNRAAVRHSLLAAALGVALVLPIASIVAPPIHVATRTLGENRAAVLPRVEAIDTILLAVPVNANAGITRVVKRPERLSPSALLFTGWIVGAALSLFPMLIGLWQIRALRRTGLPWLSGRRIVEALAHDAGIHRSIEVLLHEASPGPMTCGVMHPVIVLPHDAKNWKPEELNRAIIHELEHVRRGDWLTQCLARAVCAVYWFHPLMWIAQRRLLLEAERACDDAVLRRSEATAYADQLVGLARRLSAAKSPVPAMANRANLAARLGAVLDSQQRRGRAGKLLVALVCGVAAMVVAAISPITLVAAPQAASEASAKFEVASIRQNTKRDNAPLNSIDLGFLSAVAKSSRHGQFRVEGIPLNLLIELAYNVRNDQLYGGPSWADSDLYDVNAKAEGAATFEQMRPMLRSLLAERFKLTLRREAREFPVYELAVAKGGLKIVEATDGSCATLDPENPPPPPDRNLPIPPLNICGGVRRQMVSAPPNRTDRIEAVGISMPKLVEMLSAEVGRTVIDKTGFTGKFDFRLEFSPETAPELSADTGGTAPGASARGPSIFTALQEQPGLRLISAKGPVEVLVIEGVMKPLGN